MGVTGLWTVLQPCARPIKLETLAQKRLAVDASIWIYQFLKAVRDKEGNALRNAHVVGFFRRLVKLLFHGIRPVFVFDGGAPLLKKQTVTSRRARREGRKEDAVRTAGKLLSLQMQRRAQEEADQRKRAAQNEYIEQEEEVLPENLVYVDELFQTPQERQKNRNFRKKDAYHLPELDTSIHNMAGSDDPRIMSMDELEDYAQQFEGGEDINLYDFSKIDFDSPFFVSLPAADRYNILNAARIRSRLRMGLSKEQLEEMFPNRLDFSRFQIERVRERNNLTQRLMNLNGMNDDLIGVTRVAGERNREYVLVKNDGAEGGWALGVVGKKGEREGEARSTAIVIDDEKKRESEDEEWEDEMDEFEDIPIEGLNRLQKLKGKGRAVDYDLPARTGNRGSNNHSSSKTASQTRQKAVIDNSAAAPLFIQDSELNGFDENEYEGLFEDDEVIQAELDADEDLRKAIAMSLEKEKDEGDQEENSLRMALEMAEAGPSGQAERPIIPLNRSKPRFAEQSLDDEYSAIDLNKAVSEDEEPIARPLNRSKPKFVEESMESHRNPFEFEEDTSLLPARSVTPLNRSKAKVVEQPVLEERNPFSIESEDGGFTLESAMEVSLPLPVAKESLRTGAKLKVQEENNLLPFESMGMKLGGLAQLQKRKDEEKAQKEKDAEADKKKAVPLPPWFSTQENTNFKAGSAGYRMDNYDRADEEATAREAIPEYFRPIEERSKIQASKPDLVVLSDEGSEGSDVEMIDIPISKPPEAIPSPAITMSDIADKNRLAPSIGEAPTVRNAANESDEDLEWDVSDDDVAQKKTTSVPTITRDSTRDEGPDDNNDEYGDVLDSEEEDLLHQMEAENVEHARFASDFNQRSTEENVIDYERELRTLRNQQKRDKRDADEVTHIMVTECQQLLQMFGVPYITAPMEAEAQCAELVRLGLVDGIVTDDSDIFLFGGTRVYKNMFNQAKFVECYLTSDMENEYSLDRRKLIRLAHLLGSDYTDGLPNVGPVTALEILAEFSSENGLEDFKNWWTAVQSGAIPSVDDNSKLRKKLRKLSEKLFLAPAFPDERVDIAYLEPEVDKDNTPFEWGIPDLQGLRNFLMATIGWSPDRTDEILVPVIRDMNRKLIEGSQVNITNYFSGKVGAGAFAPRVRGENKSKRMESALMSLHRQTLKRQGSSMDKEIVQQRADDESSSTDEERQVIVSMNGRIKVPAKSKPSKVGQLKTAKKQKKGKRSKSDSDSSSGSDLDHSEKGGSDVEVITKPKITRGKPSTKARKPASRGRKKL